MLDQGGNFNTGIFEVRASLTLRLSLYKTRVEILLYFTLKCLTRIENIFKAPKKIYIKGPRFQLQ
jgi:hypothetical protein